MSTSFERVESVTPVAQHQHTELVAVVQLADGVHWCLNTAGEGHTVLVLANILSGVSAGHEWEERPCLMSCLAWWVLVVAVGQVWGLLVVLWLPSAAAGLCGKL